jgi:hypothetical protein
MFLFVLVLTLLQPVPSHRRTAAGRGNRARRAFVVDFWMPSTTPTNAPR